MASDVSSRERFLLVDFVRSSDSVRSASRPFGADRISRTVLPGTVSAVSPGVTNAMASGSFIGIGVGVIAGVMPEDPRATTAAPCTVEAAMAASLAGSAAVSEVPVDDAVSTTERTTPLTAELPDCRWETHDDKNPVAILVRSRPTRRNALTTKGSKCPPEHLANSALASSKDIGFLYDREAVITSKASATATIRDPSGIWEPEIPFG
jgi:hypothetical protein